MRQFGKVRAPRIHYDVTVHQHSQGVYSFELCSYAYSSHGRFIDMAWLTTLDWNLFTVSWSWEK